MIAVDRTTMHGPWSPAIQRHLSDYVTGECLSQGGVGVPPKKKKHPLLVAIAGTSLSFQVDRDNCLNQSFGLILSKGLLKRCTVGSKRGHWMVFVLSIKIIVKKSKI